MADAMSEKPILREARAAVFAAVCVLVAVVGHDAFSPGGIPLWLPALSAGLLFGGVRPLTSRERDVLALMAEGRSNTAIAGILVVSEKSVEKHVGNIFSKLGLPPSDADHRRVLAVLRYLES